MPAAPPGRPRVALGAALLLGAVSLLGGCPRRSAPDRLVDVRARVDGVDAAGVDEEALGARAAEAVRASGLLAVDPQAEPRASDYRLRVRVGRGRGDDGAVRTSAIATLERLGDAADPPIEARIVYEPPATVALRGAPDAGAAAGRASIERALDGCMRELVARLRLRRGGPAELEVALRGHDEDLRAEAIRAAGARHERSVVPALIGLLGSEDAALRDQALGALVEIRDPRAVKPITQMARLKETGELPKVIDALGALGGDEARAYLEFVVSAHEDPGVKELAREALGHLERRDAAR